MNTEELTGQESDDQLIKDIKQLEVTALGEGAVACQACGSQLREGRRIVVYAFRPAGTPTFEIGYVKCANGRRVPAECFTLGVRELVVEGRVGMCSDQASQSSWPVLVAPEVVAVSAAATKSLRWIADDALSSACGETGRSVNRRAEPDGPIPLVDQVLRERVEEKCAELRESDALCGGGQR